MKSINFEILQRDTFLKFLSEMVKINNSILLEFDLQEDLVISKTHFDTKIIRKNELKLSEIFKFNKSDITIDKLKGKIIFSIFDLAVLVKIINKFVTDGDTLVLCHEDFNFVTNRKGSKSNNSVTMVDRPSVDLTQVLIKTEGDTKATYVFDCGEFKDYVYFTDSFIDELKSNDKHQFTVKFDEKELNHLLELNNSFSNNSEKLTIQVKDNVDGLIAFADTDSVGINFNEILEKYFIEKYDTKTETEITIDFFEFRLTDYLEKSIEKYVKKFNCNDRILNLEFENVYGRMILLGKKHYIADVSWKAPNIFYKLGTKVSFKGVSLKKGSASIFAKKHLYNEVKFWFKPT